MLPVFRAACVAVLWLVAVFKCLLPEMLLPAMLLPAMLLPAMLLPAVRLPQTSLTGHLLPRFRFCLLLLRQSLLPVFRCFAVAVSCQ